MLSDAIINNKVNIKCTPSSSTAANQLVIGPIDPITAELGSTQVSIQYKITTIGTLSTTITCTATSENSGTQYNAAITTAIFQISPSNIKIDATAFSDSTSGSYFFVS
jgi:hypothetical protein